MKCRHGEQDWVGHRPECAFDEKGNFVEENWNCFLITKLRQLCGSYCTEIDSGDYFWDDDESTGTFFVKDTEYDETKKNYGRSYLHGLLVILRWYKSRGKTDSFKILKGSHTVNGTERDALEIVRLYEKLGWDFEEGLWKK